MDAASSLCQPKTNLILVRWLTQFHVQLGKMMCNPNVPESWCKFNGPTSQSRTNLILGRARTCKRVNTFMYVDTSCYHFLSDSFRSSSYLSYRLMHGIIFFKRRYINSETIDFILIYVPFIREKLWLWNMSGKANTKGKKWKWSSGYMKPFHFSK
jgi:hypothetical protein